MFFSIASFGEKNRSTDSKRITKNNKKQLDTKQSKMVSSNNCFSKPVGRDLTKLYKQRSKSPTEGRTLYENQSQLSPQSGLCSAQ